MKPTYAVIFTSTKKEYSADYDAMAEQIGSIMQAQKGFISIESVRDGDGRGITVCLWESLEDIRRWKENEVHQNAQALGKSEWYDRYHVRVCKIEYEYGSGDDEVTT